MEFLILGPVEVVGPGGAVAIGGSRERVLLARLLLSANQVVSSERLVDDLWEGEPTDGALPALQVYVSRLRKALRSCGPDDVVVTRAPGYLLRVASGDLDATRFEALLSDARRQLASGGHEVASVTLRGALALWRGRALAEVADMPFARAEAARLEEARLAAVEERIEADLACGRHAELIGELAALVSEHPLRERLWAQRMLALYRVGRQAEALRAYQDLRRFLGEQLGIEPSAALSRLEAGVLRQDPELDWPPAGHPIPPAPPPTAVPLGSHAQERFVTAPPAEVSSAAPAGVVTFLFTDLVGSTELLQQLGDDTADELRRRHFRLLREAVSARGGNEVKSLGDGLMVAFASPLAAVGCAVAVQQAVERDNRRHSGALAVRVGLHAGEPLSEDDDYFGTPVVVAKRLCDRAEGGQILASALVRALVGSRGAHTFCDLGDLTLKGLDDPVAACEVVWSVPEQGEVAGQLPLPVPMQREESFPVVGRSGELERLEVAWKEASSGQRSLVLVAGEPGIGKTRLAFEAARRAHGEGAIVLFGRCDEGLGVPYQPFVEALSTYVRQTPMPALGRLAGELVRLVPDVTDRVDGLPPPLCSDPETERYRLFDAVAAWLAAASETAPVVLVVDDLHWATRATLFLLRHLVRSAEQLRLLVVVTYRDTEPDFAPEAADATVDLLRRPGVARIALCGLDEAGVEAFMESRARHELDDDARALARVVHGETAGNPFFVGQVFRHLAETGAVVRQAGRWVAGQPDAEISIPDDVRDVVGRRLAHLPEETRDVLTLAAVAGERFELATLVTA
ncbi:MAG TPA: BTAD domain-containing putative transcriptional regulator, partial [Acidimicrobiia bacterium]|nr:BTAD domain-containing putative transcriptional regulator [Acidimicrobiia bacterium]